MIIVGRLAGIAQSLFFLVQYGGFCAVHGLFLQTLLLVPALLKTALHIVLHRASHRGGDAA